MPSISLAVSGQTSDAYEVGPGARITASGSGYVEWSSNSLADVRNGVATWSTWPKGATTGYADTLRRVLIRGVATGALSVTWDESERDEGPDDAYWQEQVPAWSLDSSGNVQGLVGPAGGALGVGIVQGSARGGFDDADSWSEPVRLVTAGADTPAATVYWPFVVKTDRIASPLGRYYLYYSTDHDAGAGGVYMSYSDNLSGPWVSYGEVYTDSAAGSSQTETPSVLWDSHAGNFRLFYHQVSAKYGVSDASSALGVQSTLSATSSDGLTWTKDPDFVLDVPALADVHGDGHTGYFLPFRTRRGTFAYSLYGGGDGPDFVLWRCVGGLDDWRTDGASLGYEYHMTQGAPLDGRRVEWNSSFVAESGGVEYLVARLNDGASGSDPGDCLIAVAPISADYRKVVGRPVVVWEASQTWETENLRSVCPYIENGVLYVLYSVNETTIGMISHVL